MILIEILNKVLNKIKKFIYLCLSKVDDYIKNDPNGKFVVSFILLKLVIYLIIIII